MKTYIGIDPGKSGGIAQLDESHDVIVVNSWKMPETERDIWSIFDNFDSRISFALIEAVHAMPKQGVTSSFTFGQNYGLLRGLLIASEIPFDTVTPQRWQKLIGCMSKGDKNVTKAKAQQLFPCQRVTHKNADALLIAEYCRRTRSATEISQ